MLKKLTSPALFKNKLLLLLIAVVAATIILAILVQPFLILVMGIGLPAACIVGIILFLAWTPPIPKSAKLEVKAEPVEIIADGESKSALTIQLLGQNDKPIPAFADVDVRLTTTGGKIESEVVRIPKGKEMGQTFLISSKEFGTVKVSADAKGLESIGVTLTFLEKARFCMGCGARMKVKDRECKKCHAHPEDFGGMETRTCHCGMVIPFTARYCSECGARQPPMRGDKTSG